MEGIFRLAGSEKRIKELKIAFDSPERYGKGLDWTGYTVHDAANILRRYFNQLPEPIIPLDFYDRFRDPLRNHQAQAVGAIEAQSPSVGDFDPDEAIKIFQNLITELPPLNRQLLLYILDLLAVFASKSDLNKMTTPNLAAIFQPGILSHPQHDMAPPEYRLSQDVLIFLIENQDSFLIGMQGTAADPETVRDVQSGTPTKSPTTPTTPGRSKTIIGRSSSSASAGAESVKKFGSIRRNASVSSSKNSKRSENGPNVVAGGMNSPGTPTGGVHRSNTVPSRRGGSNATSPRYSREKNSDPSTPNPSSPVAALDAGKPRQASLQSTPVTTAAPQFRMDPQVTSASSSEATTPVAATIGSDTSSAINRDYQTLRKDTTPLLSPSTGSTERTAERSASYTPSTSSGKGFLGIFSSQSPTSDGEGRKPNKLQKKRIPGSSLSSAHSSSQSLEREGQSDASQKSPVSPGPIVPTDLDEKAVEGYSYTTAETTPTGDQAAQTTPSRDSTGATLRPTVSPSHSYNSTTDVSDADMVGDDMPKEQSVQPEKQKRGHRWRFSRSQNKLEPSSPPSSNPLGTMTAKEQTTSRSTVGSNGGQPRRSFQDPVPLAPAATDPAAGSPMQSATVQSSSTDPVFSDSEKERKSGPMSWIRGKMREHKDKEAEKRARTPDRSREQRESKQDLGLPPSSEGMPIRGKSFEQPRTSSGASPGAVAAAQQAAVNTSEPAESSPESAAATTAPAAGVPAATNGDGVGAQNVEATSKEQATE